MNPPCKPFVRTPLGNAPRKPPLPIPHLLQGGEEGSTADALAALQAEVRCIRHARALQQGDPQQDPPWAPLSDSEGPDARISQLEGQLAQMEVGMYFFHSHFCLCVCASPRAFVGKHCESLLLCECVLSLQVHLPVCTYACKDVSLEWYI